MRIAVVSCWKYRDAWEPFIGLFRKFWPDRQATLVADRIDPMPKCSWDEWYESGVDSWCQTLTAYADEAPECVLVMQEDFLLNAPVNGKLVSHAIDILNGSNVGAVRLYPCPGATDSSEDPYFAPVAPGTMYRTSCQATIWHPRYLAQIASRFNTPSEFELQGSKWASENLPQEVWAFKREVQPWPISYFCSAISRGKWEPAALEFCRQQGIEVDTSMRPIA